METNIVLKSDWLLAVEGKVPADEVRAERAKLIRYFAKRVKLAGFRPGKAPLSMIEERYAEDIKTELVEEFAVRAYRQALEEKKLRPLSQGRLAHWNFIQDDELRFEVEAEILPEVEVRGYRQLKLEAVPRPSNDELLERRIEAMRQRAARTEPVERAAHEGDYVRCDYSVYRDGRKQEKQSGVIIQIGDKENFPEINEALSGKSAGEVAQAKVVYPSDAGELAGREASFKFYILEVKERRVPEVSDAFAKEMGFESLEKMREKLVEAADGDAERMTRERREDQLFKQLLELHPFDPPPSLVHERTHYLMRRLGLPETEEAHEQIEAKAAEHVKLDLILEKIAEKEEIKVSDQELEAWFQERARSVGIPLTQAKALWRKDAAMDEARRRKTLDFLLEQATKGGLVVYPDSH